MIEIELIGGRADGKKLNLPLVSEIAKGKSGDFYILVFHAERGSWAYVEEKRYEALQERGKIEEMKMDEFFRLHDPDASGMGDCQIEK